MFVNNYFVEEVAFLIFLTIAKAFAMLSRVTYSGTCVDTIGRFIKQLPNRLSLINSKSRKVIVVIYEP